MKARAAELRPAGRAEHAPAHHLSGRSCAIPTRRSKRRAAWRDATQDSRTSEDRQLEQRRADHRAGPHLRHRHGPDQLGRARPGRTPLFWFGALRASASRCCCCSCSPWRCCSPRAWASGASSIPVAWGFAITNFVWWIGIGHAGTLISAILLLLQPEVAQLDQPLRRGHDALRRGLRRHVPAAAPGPPVAVLLAVALPQHHERAAAVPQPAGLGRVRGLHLRHRLAAVLVHRADPRSGHAARPRAATAFAQVIYGMLALGWRGSARHWQRYETAYLLLAGLATPLVLSVHTVVSFDFTVAIVPGWHTTIFPPYFVAGAIYSGFAMVLVLAIPLRAVYGLQDLITDAAPGELRQGHAGHRPDRRLRLRHGRRSWPGTAATSTRAP